MGSVTGDGGTIVVETTEPTAVRAVLDTLVRAGVTTVSTAPPSLEEVYLRLIGERGLAVG